MKNLPVFFQYRRKIRFVTSLNNPETDAQSVSSFDAQIRLSWHRLHMTKRLPSSVPKRDGTPQLPARYRFPGTTLWFGDRFHTYNIYLNKYARRVNHASAFSSALQEQDYSTVKPKADLFRGSVDITIVTIHGQTEPFVMLHRTISNVHLIQKTDGMKPICTNGWLKDKVTAKKFTRQ